MSEGFDELVLAALQRRMLKDISDNPVISLDYGSRFKLPQELLQKAFHGLDEKRIIELVKQNIEEQIAKTMVNNMLTEVTNDTKRMMSDNILRERLKYLIYPQIMRIIDEEAAKRGT